MPGARRSLINDVTLEDEDVKGDPILFPNQEIRRMLRLARVEAGDTFYDLGSGWGQNLILALTEAGAGKVVGIEQDGERREVSLKRLAKWARKRPELKGRFSVVSGDFDDLLKGELEGANLKEATVVFYGLSTYRELLQGIERNWKGQQGKRLAYRWVFPEILPDRKDYPFFVSDFPFKKPRTELEWLNKVVGKERSSIEEGTPETEELWEELTHDYDLKREAREIKYYKKRLRETLTRKSRFDR
jgi:precorrin-6B methylase 2